MQALEISRTGLDVEWRRLQVIADNLANAGSPGSGWQPHRLISGPKGDFAALVEKNGRDNLTVALRGAEVRSVVVQGLPPRLVHEPGNPASDARGYVAYPGVDQAAEMTLMIKTARIYEANIAAMNAARQMYSKALEVGRR